MFDDIISFVIIRFHELCSSRRNFKLLWVCRIREPPRERLHSETAVDCSTCALSSLF